MFHSQTFLKQLELLVNYCLQKFGKNIAVYAAYVTEKQDICSASVGYVSASHSKQRKVAKNWSTEKLLIKNAPLQVVVCGN